MDVHFNSQFQRFLLNSVPNFRGSWIFYTFMLKIAPKKLRFCSLYESNMLLDLSDPAQFSIVNTRKGLHELGTVRFLKNTLSKGDIFVDVGANFGFFSSIASKVVGDDGLVLAFEPQKNAFFQLVNTIARNKLFNCIPFKMALGENMKSTISMKKSWFRQSTSAFMTAGFSVLSDTFDNLMKAFSTTRKIKAVKIDVEGAELPVIKGFLDILKKDKPLLIIEPDYHSQKRFGFNFNGLISYLSSIGYKPTLFLGTDGEITEYQNKREIVCPVVFNYIE